MSHLLTYLFFLPLCVSAVMLFLPAAKWKVFRWLSLAAMSLELFLSILMAYLYDKDHAATRWGEAFQFVERLPWIRLGLGDVGQFRVDYYVGVDGISLPLVLLSSLVLLIGVVSSWQIQEKAKGYHILYLILSASIIGCFISLDFFLFYLCFEFMLLPMFFLIGIWGGKRRSYASIKFFLYTLFGSLFILVVMIALYLSVEEEGGHSFSMIVMLEGDYLSGSFLEPGGSEKIMGFGARALAFVCLLVGFGIKLPIVPLHTWLPDAHVEAPTPISVVLAGLLLKVGAYGLLRILYGIFPDMAADFAVWIALFGVLSILYGGLNALAQQDLKKMVAYSSVSHMGFVMLGLATMTSLGLSGALFHMISHGLISPALFILVGVIYSRTGDRAMENFSGLAAKMPMYAFFTALFFFAGLGLPGLSGFVGELMVLIGAFAAEDLSSWLAFLAVGGILISAAYFLWTLQRVFFGPYFVRKTSWQPAMNDLMVREQVMLVPLALLVILLGIFPSQLLDYSRQTLALFMDHLNGFAP